MVSKCLNPLCPATFKHLGQGRLFRIDFREADKKNDAAANNVVASVVGGANPIEHFWLCERCAASLTITLSHSGEVQLLPGEQGHRNESGAVQNGPPRGRFHGA
jgi:hypothetical protein